MPVDIDTATLPDAVLWDMDGTLVDSEPYWIAAESALVQEFGGTWSTEQALSLVGNPLPVSAKIMQGEGVDLPADAIIDRLTEAVVAACRVSMPWKDGALDRLAELRSAGVPCALVTMSYRVFADVVVAAAPAGTFDAVVSGDQVRRGKPDPEPYLTAAERLGARIGRCVAVEDSLTGVRSAEAAGAHTIGVVHLVDIPGAPGRSRIGSLADLDLAAIRRIAAGEVIDLVDR